MAYELSFRRGVKNWLEVAKHIAASSHTWSTEEEEWFGEVGLDADAGVFTDEQIKELEVPMNMDEFVEKANSFRDETMCGCVCIHS